MKRFLLAMGVAAGIFAISTTTANTNYGTPRDLGFLKGDTTPKKDTTSRKDTTGRRRDSLNLPGIAQ